MSTGSSQVALSAADKLRLERIERIAASGVPGVALLVEELSDPSWAVRRGVISALARQGDAAVAALCRALADGRTDETRIAATVDALVASKGAVEEALLPLAEHPNPAVVYDVAQVLGRRRSGPGVPLLAKLTRHEDDNVAVAAIEALGNIGGRFAVTALIEAAESGHFFRTFPAIDVLGRSGDPAAVGPLVALLDKQVYTLEVVRALGRIGDERAISPLVRLLARGGETVLRAVVAALTEIQSAHRLRYGNRQVVLSAIRSEALPASLGRRLASCMRGASNAERSALCTALGWVGGEDAIAGLLEQLNDDVEVARSAAQTLFELGLGAERQLLGILRTGDSAQRVAVLPFMARRSSVGPDVAACLDDPDPAVRTAACVALGRIGDTSAAPALFERLLDDDVKVAQAAQSAIQSLGSPQTEALTLEAVRSEDPRLRRAALRIIAYYGYASGLEALLEAMQAPDEKLRDAAIYGLPFIEAPRALEALLAAAQHDSPRTRAAAMRALGQVSPQQAVLETLRQGLSDKEAWVRYYAVQSLGKLHDVASEQAIIARLEDAAGQVRVAVVDALAVLNTDKGMQALREASASPDADVRRAALLGMGVAQRPESIATLLTALRVREPSTQLVALSALAEFTSPEVEPALLDAAQDPDLSVRNAAVGFLASRHGAKATEQLISLMAFPALKELVLSSLTTPVSGRIAGLQAALQAADDHLAPLLVGALLRMERADSNAALFEVLRSAGQPGRRAAAVAAASLGTSAAQSALERAAREDADPEVRRISALALVP